MAFSVTCTDCGTEIENAIETGACPKCGRDVIRSIQIE